MFYCSLQATHNNVLLIVPWPLGQIPDESYTHANTPGSLLHRCWERRWRRWLTRSQYAQQQQRFLLPENRRRSSSIVWCHALLANSFFALSSVGDSRFDGQSRKKCLARYRCCSIHFLDAKVFFCFLRQTTVGAGGWLFSSQINFTTLLVVSRKHFLLRSAAGNLNPPPPQIIRLIGFYLSIRFKFSCLLRFPVFFYYFYCPASPVSNSSLFAKYSFTAAWLRNSPFSLSEEGGMFGFQKFSF